jgi:NAD(P)-dependent dehydrogenase (short-subunit alcohol dehydrogenase family)
MLYSLSTVALGLSESFKYQLIVRRLKLEGHPYLRFLIMPKSSYSLFSSFGRVATSLSFTHMARAAHPIGRLGTPEDIAKGIVFLASDDAAFMTGAGLVIDGGLTAQ